MEGLIAVDTFGCVVLLPPAWDLEVVDVITNTAADTSPIDGFEDEDGNANPDVQILMAVPKILFDVQASRGQDLPPDGDAPEALGADNDLIKVRVFDYTCQNAFDDATMQTSPTPRLLPLTVVRGEGNYQVGENIPEGTQPFYVDIELNPDDLVGSEIWNTAPPYDVGSIEFCLRVDLRSDTGGE